MRRSHSKLTAKSRTTIPKVIRQALQLRPGDTISYEIRGDVVTLRKESDVHAGYLNAIQETLSEWDRPEDGAAYDDL